MCDIGNKIKKVRELKNFNQDYVANQLGISQSQYSRYENGTSIVDEVNLQKIAHILDVPVEFIENFDTIFENLTKQLKAKEDFIQIIENEFNKSYKPRTYLNNAKSYARFYSLVNLSSKTYLSQEQLLSLLKETSLFRVKPYKSSTKLDFVDLLVVEKVFQNIDYGYFHRNYDSNLWIINPVGSVSRGINHFCYTLYDNLLCNYSALTAKILNPDGSLLSYNSSIYYERFQKFNNGIPKLLEKFLIDLIGNPDKRTEGIRKDDWVFVICPAANGRPADVIVEYGKPPFSKENDFENSTIQDISTFLKWKEVLINNLNSEHLTYSKAKKNFHFSYREHLIGNHTDDWLGRLIYKSCKANVVTIYVNIDIFIGDNDQYYALLKCLLLAFQRVFSIFVANSDKENA